MTGGAVITGAGCCATADDSCNANQTAKPARMKVNEHRYNTDSVPGSKTANTRHGSFPCRRWKPAFCFHKVYSITRSCHKPCNSRQKSDSERIVSWQICDQ